MGLTDAAVDGYFLLSNDDPPKCKECRQRMVYDFERDEWICWECQEPAICGACRGSGMGMTPKHRCGACKGSGENKRQEEV